MKNMEPLGVALIRATFGIRVEDKAGMTNLYYAVEGGVASACLYEGQILIYLYNPSTSYELVGVFNQPTSVTKSYQKGVSYG